MQVGQSLGKYVGIEVFVHILASKLFIKINISSSMAWAGEAKVIYIGEIMILEIF